jgi:hypothetical protein
MMVKLQAGGEYINHYGDVRIIVKVNHLGWYFDDYGFIYDENGNWLVDSPTGGKEINNIDVKFNLKEKQ